MNTNDAPQAANLDNLVMMVNLALKVLSMRAMTVLALLLNAGVCTWAISTESWPRLAGAALFAVTSWCTVNLKPPKGDGNA